jgi:cysteine synthase A
MPIHASVLELIGRTPIVKARRLDTGPCELYFKLESQNPGGSIKDRIGLSMIEAAEQAGKIKPGDTLVEGTAGNTGIGLALVANARGYRTVIVIPQTQSQEKKDALRLYGAELREVPAAPYSDPNNYVHVAERLAAELARSEPHGVLYANQWDNLSNRDGHLRTTGPEIWRQTDGRVDGFICSIGTGGTLAGVGQYLKERKPDVVIAAADPMGAAMYNYIKHGELRSTGTSITEGIGQSRITRNLQDAPIDDAYQIRDDEALPVLFELLREEGLCLGGSSGINVAGAIRLARELGPGHTIVTILADAGTRYQSKLYNPAFLREMHLPVPAWLG